MEYKLKISLAVDQKMIDLDRKHREKVEKKTGRPFNDAEWFRYKTMTIRRPAR